MVENFENQADSIKKFTDTPTSIAHRCIPMTSINSKRIKNPWFTDEYKKAIKARKKQKDSSIIHRHQLI